MIARATLLVAALLSACATGSPAPEPAEERLADNVTVRRLAPGVWLHVTEGRAGGILYPANGLLLEADGGSILVDTGWDDAQGEALLAWARRMGRPVRTAIVTHAHNDRTGGVGAMRRAGVRVVGHPLTVGLAAAEGRIGVDSLGGLGSAAVRVGGAEVFFPGAGHASDNLVVYLPRQRVLYGGCLVKADTATTVGNVADADVPGWPGAVERVRLRYPAARLVVPGHGRVSAGTAALTATERLIAEKGPAALEAHRRSF